MSESNGTTIPAKFIGWIIAGVITLVVLIIGVTIFATWQGVIDEGNRREATLSARYADGANYLSNCVVKSAQSADVAVAQADKLNEILANAVSGRYDNASSTAVDNGKLFSAIVEAYPDLSGLDKTFQLVVSTINGCRDDFKTAQSRILDSVKDFDAWRTGSFTTRMFATGFPDHNLYVTVAGQNAHGQDALDKMRVPIIDTVTEAIYKDGTFEVTDPFGTDD